MQHAANLFYSTLNTLYDAETLRFLVPSSYKQNMGTGDFSFSVVKMPLSLSLFVKYLKLALKCYYKYVPNQYSYIATGSMSYHAPLYIIKR